MISYSGLLAGVLSLISSHIVAADLVVQSERLRNFQGCTESQQKQITEAWHEAVKIAHLVKDDINFSWYAERDFFGSEGNSGLAQDDIRGPFEISPKRG